MQASRYASLLPELFRHKTTKIRIFQPKFILIDFHGTISERKWEDKIIFPYVKKVLNNFLIENINEQEIQNCIAGLKNESFEQRFTYKYDDAPIIDDITTINEQQNANDSDVEASAQIANQMSEFLLWQLNMKKETRETQIIQRLVWQDGFKRRKILTPLYDDVFRCIKRWHDVYNCKIYIISSVEVETLELLFTNTDKGNLNQYIAGYICPKAIGDKMLTETYKTFYDRLTTLQKDQQQKNSNASTSNNNSSPSPKEESPTNKITNNKTNNKPTAKTTKLAPSSPVSSKSSLGSQSSEILGKPILFLTDSGQEAKAAIQVADGQAYECLLVNRPGNKRIRTYYLSQFAYIDKFDDIDFV